MSVIQIPSKNIYSVNLQKTTKTNANGISVVQNKTSIERRTILDQTIYPFTKKYVEHYETGETPPPNQQDNYEYYDYDASLPTEEYGANGYFRTISIRFLMENSSAVLFGNQAKVSVSAEFITGDVYYSEDFDIETNFFVKETIKPDSFSEEKDAILYNQGASFSFKPFGGGNAVISIFAPENGNEKIYKSSKCYIEINFPISRYFEVIILRKKTIFTKINVKIEADVLVETNENLKSGTTPYITLESNELFNDKSLIDGETSSERLISISQPYVVGKEVAKLRCSIGEYKDENGNVIISTKNPSKMNFETGDVVNPMVFTSKGTDEPILPQKILEVIGVDFVYDGAVWQDLTLQEV